MRANQEDARAAQQSPRSSVISVVGRNLADRNHRGHRGTQSVTGIHDWRIVSDDGEWVTFVAKNYRDGTREPVRIRGVELVRRFCLHILPRGFHRSRAYGLFSARKRKEELPHCRKLLGVQEGPSPATDNDHEPLGDDHEELLIAPAEQDDTDHEERRTKKRCPRCLLWAMVWVARFTAAEIEFRQAREKQLGELLLGVVTTWDVDRAESLSQWQHDVDTLRQLQLRQLVFW